MEHTITVALAGNPNSGKTTIFNQLTGARQHVANYPGVTVDRKEGFCRHGETGIRVVDLPGTYSLTAYSLEEVVTRNFLIDERPDVVVDVLDASNIERNLYLAVQLLELGVPVVLVFNMSDVARVRGLEFDLPRLSELLGMPIVSTVGHRGEGLNQLLDAVVAMAGRPAPPAPARVDYGPEIEAAIEAIEALLNEGDSPATPPRRWIATKLLENDQDVVGTMASPGVIDAARDRIRHLESILGDTPEIIMADRRYGFISGACQETVRSTVEARHTMSDRIDVIVTSRFLGLPLFLGLMYLTFHVTFSLGAFPVAWIEAGLDWSAVAIGQLWPAGSLTAARSLLLDGVLPGVGGVIVLLPNIFILFLAIALLEDSGYMARAAFVMDGLMHRIGLHGKSFIPMLIGFGCSVPGILATRTLDSTRDRLVTMLVVPLMSCGARLTIYALIVPAFFPKSWHAPMMMTVYLIGIVLAVGAAKWLRVTVLRGESTPLVMELPPYRVPTLRGMLLHMWTRSGHYLRKAGTVILAVSVVLWAMTYYPRKAFEGGRTDPATPAERAEQLSQSVAGRVGHVLEPVLRPMGFDWRIGTALLGALAAKEVFVSQLGIVFAVDDAEHPEALREELRRNYPPLVGFCILLFCLISMPCVPTLAAIRSESGSWRWSLFQFASLTALGFLVTAAVFQAGTLLGLGTRIL